MANSEWDWKVQFDENGFSDVWLINGYFVTIHFLFL